MPDVLNSQLRFDSHAINALGCFRPGPIIRDDDLEILELLNTVSPQDLLQPRGLVVCAQNYANCRFFTFHPNHSTQTILDFSKTGKDKFPPGFDRAFFGMVGFKPTPAKLENDIGEGLVAFAAMRFSPPVQQCEFRVFRRT